MALPNLPAESHSPPIIHLKKSRAMCGVSYEGPGSEPHSSGNQSSPARRPRDRVPGHRDQGIPEGPEAHSQARIKPRQIQQQLEPGSPAPIKGPRDLCDAQMAPPRHRQGSCLVKLRVTAGQHSHHPHWPLACVHQCPLPGMPFPPHTR